MKEKKVLGGDTMIRISKEVRAKLKLQAAKQGLTLKEHLNRIASK